MTDSPARMIWHAPSHEKSERSTDWFWALGIVAIAGATLSVVFGNLLFAIIIMLAAGILAALSLREPRVCEIEITDAGIRIDHSLYPYRSLKAFWVDIETRSLPHLIISTDSLLNPQLVFILPEELSPASVRAHLLRHLPEEEMHESFASRVSELIGL